MALSMGFKLRLGPECLGTLVTRQLQGLVIIIHVLGMFGELYLPNTTGQINPPGSLVVGNDASLLDPIRHIC